MSKAKVRLYEIRGSVPPTEGRSWRSNFASMVLAGTLAEAVAYIQATRPEGTEVHDAISRSSGKPVEWADEPS